MLAVSTDGVAITVNTRREDDYVWNSNVPVVWGALACVPSGDPVAKAEQRGGVGTHEPHGADAASSMAA